MVKAVHTQFRHPSNQQTEMRATGTHCPIQVLKCLCKPWSLGLLDCNGGEIDVQNTLHYSHPWDYSERVLIRGRSLISGSILK